MNKNKILIVEDEEGIREGLTYLLSEQYSVEEAENGVEGLKKAIRNQPNLILLDLKMPEMDGFQVLKALRADKEFDHIPIIVLSAFNSPADRTKAFELGADDYINKPFDRAELMARIQRKLHGTEIKQVSSPNNLIIKNNLELDLRNHQLNIGKNQISLSAIEFKIIHVLSQHFEQLVSRDTIVDHVWEKQPVSPRLIDPHILSLRSKLNDVNLTIQSVYGKGYIFKTL